jgi:exopolysaccharide biosynthesis polyprenyl glycosylphosphotransferase
MSDLQKHPRYKWAVALLDYVSSVSGLIISIHVSEIIGGPRDIIDFNSKLALSLLYLLFAPLLILLFQILGLYHIQTITNTGRSFILISKTCSLFILLFLSFAFVTEIRERIVPLYFISTPVTIFLLLSARQLCYLLIKRTYFLSDRVIIIGAGVKGQLLLSIFSNDVNVKKTVGFIDDNLLQDRDVAGLPVLGKIFDSHLIAKKNSVDFFVMAIDNISREHFFEILKYFNENNLTIYITSNYLKVLHGNIQVDTFNKYDLIRIGHPIQSGLLKLSKRCFDMVVGVTGIILLSPLLIALAVLIKMTSKGPIIYKQTRIGKEGQPFMFYKFRSMRINSDKDETRNANIISFIKGEQGESEGNSKIVNHSRITRIGKIIRKTSVDELPQLFNVLKGDMSIVGPRPCLPIEWNVYESWQKQRLMFMPGCTGIWQVSGRSKVNFEDAVIMDLYYNCNVSLWLDVKIILNTIPVMFFSKGGE